MNKIKFILFLFIFLPLQSFASSDQPVVADNGMVVSEHRLASLVGADILRAGGNAIDAAVAVGYALAVVNPCCGNLGGGGFMTIHLANGKNIFLNFREKAPLKATKNMYLDAQGNVIEGKSMKGYLAVAVPGTVMGLDAALKKYGTMTRKQVIDPAIKLAKDGYAISAFDAKWIKAYANDFRQSPAAAAIFLKNHEPLKEGDLLVQSDLSHTLTLIKNDGTNVFYKGSIAKNVVSASEANGGILTMKDFATYTVQWMKPIICFYHGYQIISAPPPSSGGVTLCEMLNILENFPLSSLGKNSIESNRIIIEAMRYGFTDRNTALGDPDFVNNPVKKLISKSYAKEISEKIRKNKTAPNKQVNVGNEGKETTHYSVVDKKGNAVSVTYTINGLYGAKVIADHTGFFLNDEMDDFSIKSGSPNEFGLVMSDTNDIQPGKRPLSSMTPTIILHNKELYMVVGSPGGPRIITSVLHAILNVMDFGMNMQQAVNAPRFHYQVYPDQVAVEPGAFDDKTLRGLEALGYTIDQQNTWSVDEAIMIDPVTKKRHGANDDIRRPAGAAIGH